MAPKTSNHVKFQVRRLDHSSHYWDTVAICADNAQALMTTLRTLERAGYAMEYMRVLRYSGKKLMAVAN